MSEGLIARIKRWEWRLLVLLIYFLPLKEAPKNVIWGFLLFLFLTRTLASRAWPTTGKFGLTTVAWVSAGIVSSFFAIEPYVSWKGLWDMLRASSFLWIVAAQIREDDRLVKLVRHILFSATLASVVGLGNCVWNLLIKKTSLSTVKVGLPSVGHPNQSGIYLAMCWLLAIAAVCRQGVFPSWKVGVVCLGIMGIAFFGTMARVALAVSGFMTVFFIIQNRRNAPKWFLNLLVAGIGVSIPVALAVPSIRNKLMFRGSFSNRTGIWNNVLEVIWDRPWTGVGLNNFKNVALDGGQDGIHLTTDHAHNVYFNTLLQTGFIGFFIFSLLIAVVGAGILKFYFSNHADKRWAAYVIGSVWVIIVGVGFSATTLHHEMAILFFIMLGVLSGLQTSVRTVEYHPLRKKATAV